MVKKQKRPVKKPLALKISKKTEQVLAENRISNGIKKTKIRVIGIGGGGSSIVSEIASRMKKATFVVANTDLQALRRVSRKTIRFQFGQSFTQGLGTGMNVELGKMAAQSEKEKIKKLFQGHDLCIIVACLGGGVSSGATPVFAKISRNLGNITYGIFTLPFKFEGEKKMEIARSTLEKLKPKLGALSVIPNERIFQTIDKNTPLKSALSAINKRLAESLEGLIETIYQPGLINIDFADLRTILTGSGKLAFLNTIEVQGTNRGNEAIKKVLTCPLYSYTIRGAKGLLFNIVGAKELSLAEVSQISKSIFEMANPEAKIIFGISQNKKYQDKIKVTLLATGCGTKIFPGKPKKRRRRKKILPKTLRRRTLPSPKKSRLPKRKIKVRKKIKTKPKRVKVKVLKEPEESEAIQAEIETPKDPAYTVGPTGQAKIRKNALQIKKEVEEAEKELLKQEEIWEPPTFLRKNQNKPR